MKVLIVYDSVYGNTEKIARSIGNVIAGDVKIVSAGEAVPSELESFGLLIMGSPTYGGRPTQTMQNFIDNIPCLK